MTGIKSLHPALWIVPSVMLLLALAPWPYGYYLLLRIVVCICAGVIAYKTYNDPGVTFWTAALIALAVLFNPIIPVHLTRPIWSVVNAAGAALLAIHYFVRRRALG